MKYSFCKNCGRHMATRRCPLEFLHFSSSGSVEQGLMGDGETEGSEQVGFLLHFLAEESDEIETGRAPGVSPPLRKLGVGCATLSTEGLERGEQESAVSSHG